MTLALVLARRGHLHSWLLTISRGAYIMWDITLLWAVIVQRAHKFVGYCVLGAGAFPGSGAYVSWAAARICLTGGSRRSQRYTLSEWAALDTSKNLYKYVPHGLLQRCLVFEVTRMASTFDSLGSRIQHVCS